MTTPHARLQRARKDSGYETAADAARAFGWNENSYRSRENGQRGIPRKWMIAYAKAFKISLTWLMTGSTDDRGVPAGGNMRTVPILEWGELAMHRLSNGGGLDLEKAGTSRSVLYVPREIDGELVALTVRDASMLDSKDAKLSLWPEDQVVIDVSMRRPKPGQIALIEDAEARDHVFRRATFPNAKTIRFVAANPDYPPIDLPVGSARILGVVRLIQRKVP